MRSARPARALTVVGPSGSWRVLSNLVQRTRNTRCATGSTASRSPTRAMNASVPTVREVTGAGEVPRHLLGHR